MSPPAMTSCIYFIARVDCTFAIPLNTFSVNGVPTNLLAIVHINALLMPAAVAPTADAPFTLACKAWSPAPVMMIRGIPAPPIADALMMPPCLSHRLAMPLVTIRFCSRSTLAFTISCNLSDTAFSPITSKELAISSAVDLPRRSTGLYNISIASLVFVSNNSGKSVRICSAHSAYSLRISPLVSLKYASGFCAAIMASAGEVIHPVRAADGASLILCS